MRSWPNGNWIGSGIQLLGAGMIVVALIAFARETVEILRGVLPPGVPCLHQPGFARWARECIPWAECRGLVASALRRAVHRDAGLIRVMVLAAAALVVAGAVRRAGITPLRSSAGSAR